MKLMSCPLFIPFYCEQQQTTCKHTDLYRLTESNCLLNDILEAVRPHVNLTYDNILAHINTIYVLKTKTGALAGQGYLRLKVSNNISIRTPI